MTTEVQRILRPPGSRAAPPKVLLIGERDQTLDYIQWAERHGIGVEVLTLETCRQLLGDANASLGAAVGDVVTFGDRNQLLAAELKRRLGLPHRSQEALEVLTDKALLKRRLAALREPAPSNAAEQQAGPGYPPQRAPGGVERSGGMHMSGGRAQRPGSPKGM